MKQIVAGTLTEFIGEVLKAGAEGYVIKDLTDFAPNVVGSTYYATVFPAEVTSPSLGTDVIVDEPKVKTKVK